MNLEAILKDIQSAVNAELGKGYESTATLVASQSKMMAEQAAWIANERATGSLKDNAKLYDHFLAQMHRHVNELAQSVTMSTVLTIEQAWNAIANVLWGAMRQILSTAGMPDSLLPETPPLNL